jgi:hypothetical protein
MLQGRIDLVLQIFFLKFENNFEATLLRVKVGEIGQSRSKLVQNGVWA